MLLRHTHADLPGARHDVRLDSPADVPTRGAHAADRARGRSHCQRTSCAAARRGAALVAIDREGTESTSPLPHGIRKMSEHQRWLEAGCCTWPRCGWPCRRCTRGGSIRPCSRMSRRMRLRACHADLYQPPRHSRRNRRNRCCGPPGGSQGPGAPCMQDPHLLVRRATGDWLLLHRGADS